MWLEQGERAFPGREKKDKVKGFVVLSASALS